MYMYSIADALNGYLHYSAFQWPGTASFLGYPVTLLFFTQRYYITASFVKTVISFPTTNTRIACVYMASHNVAF